MTIAEQVFKCQLHLGSLEDKIYSFLEELLGEECVDEVYFDYYDCSIELLRGYTCEPINSEQADKICKELGFNRIYETIYEKEKASLWVGGRYLGECHPATGDEHERELRRLKNRVRELENG